MVAFLMIGLCACTSMEGRRVHMTMMDVHTSLDDYDVDSDGWLSEDQVSRGIPAFRLEVLQPVSGVEP